MSVNIKLSNADEFQAVKSSLEIAITDVEIRLNHHKLHAADDVETINFFKDRAEVLKKIKQQMINKLKKGCFNDQV